MADHVLITGGAHRLGQLLVRSFAQAGWHVWCHYARSADAAQALQRNCALADGRWTPWLRIWRTNRKC